MERKIVEFFKYAVCAFLLAVAALSLSRGIVACQNTSMTHESSRHPASAKSLSPALPPDDFSRLASSHPALFRFGGTVWRYDETCDTVREFVVIEQWSGRADNGVSLYEEIRSDAVPGAVSDADYAERRDALVTLARDRVETFSRRAALWRTTATDPVRVKE